VKPKIVVKEEDTEKCDDDKPLKKKHKSSKQLKKAKEEIKKIEEEIEKEKSRDS